MTINNPLVEKEIKELIKVAKKTRKNAFSHRSMHKIGASVLTMDGKIFGGCNVESAISGLGTCAERCAVDNAVSHGHYELRAVCTVDAQLVPICGACLQYILLFSQVSDQDIWLISADLKGNYEIKTLSQLLPEGYKTKNTKNLKTYGKKNKKIKE
ncbi:MAG TPA: cytidine deaminase [Candidatus Absconditabacterales bacterium]|nr:cytidine deaminase [Candidatus Absconditabacterales bacterium]HRU49896.1 cytidine deaminase [Candidatus Absconditabacterales bacterium]